MSQYAKGAPKTLEAAQAALIEAWVTEFNAAYADLIGYRGAAPFTTTVEQRLRQNPLVRP